MLQGFEPISLTTGVPYISVTVNGVTFNKASIVKIGKPAFVRLLLNKDNKMIAVQPCSAETEDAVIFYKENKRGLISVRWNNSEFMKTISTMMNWDLSNSSYRIDGTFWDEDNAMIFDLNTAKLT